MKLSDQSDPSPDTPIGPDAPVDGWSERVDSILGGDVVAVLGIVTSSGGVLLHSVAPVGLRDRSGGTVSFTSSLGYWKKLKRIELNPRVGLLYADRSHGDASDPLIILVQGDAEIESEPDEVFLDELYDRHFPRFLGPTLRGRIWDRLTYDYHRVRVRISVELRRLVAWKPESGQVLETHGLRWPPPEPEGQIPPRGGIEPRVSVVKAARRAAQLRTTCLAYVGGDGYPVITPVTVSARSERGLHLVTVFPIPGGGRRAGLFSQSYGPELKGTSVQHHSGWLHVSENGPVFAPHTSRGFTAPFGKRTAAVAGSLQAKAGLRQARRKGLVVGDRWRETQDTTKKAEVKEENRP